MHEFLHSEETLSGARKSLLRIQEFDTSTLEQRERLGSENCFNDAVAPAQALQTILKQLPPSSLDYFPEAELKSIENICSSNFNLFSEILNFSVAEGDVMNRQNTLIEKLRKQIQPTYSKLIPLIAFSMAKTVNFAELENQGRASVQAVKDQTEELIEELNEQNSAAKEILEEVRKTAAEQGVSQQARYFADEAKSHADLAKNWLIASAVLAATVFTYAIVTFFIPKISYLSPTNLSETIQLTVSKFLVFFVLVYGLLQSVKNFNAHRHNFVSNKHRQNALMTFKTLAEAGNTAEARDVVLQHAAAAVYAPNDSGYLKHEERSYNGNPIIGFSPKSLIDGSHASSAST